MKMAIDEDLPRSLGRILREMGYDVMNRDKIKKRGQRGLSEKLLKKYEKDGVDIGLLISSLAKTPTERAETNKELLKFKEEARKARLKRMYAHS
jgi:hypothetical protein